MKALMICQPYATLIALDAKRIETRPWRTSYRGPLAIHAAAGLGPIGGKRGLQALCETEPFNHALCDVGSNGMIDWWGKNIPDVLPRGAIVAVCSLIACKPTGDANLHGGWAIGLDEWVLTDQERAFGDYSPGRWAWLLADVRALETPIPCRGALGLWNVPTDVETQLLEVA